MIDQIWLRFVLAALITWRITHLLTAEDGPGDIIARARIRLGNGTPGKLMDCFYCLSFWVAAPTTLLVTRQKWEWPLVWLALSGAACLLERATEKPVVIQQVKEGEEEHGLLRQSTAAD